MTHSAWPTSWLISQLPDPAAIAEQEEIGDRSSEFAFAFDLMKGMPHLWRRIFLLIRVDGLDAGCAAEILRMPNKIDAVRAGSFKPKPSLRLTWKMPA